jgi:hypothetical protein
VRNGGTSAWSRKWLVEGTLSKAQSAIEEESQLRKSTQRDLVFFTGEFQMMQSLSELLDLTHIKFSIILNKS